MKYRTKTRSLVAIMIIAPIIIIIASSTLNRQETKTIKIETVDGEMYYDLNTLRPTAPPFIKPTDGKTLRLEFIEIKNGWIELTGPYPKEHANRVKATKTIAKFERIVTETELKIFKPLSRETIGNKTIVKLTRQ